MTTSEIIQLVIGCAPSVIAILTFIGVVLKVCHEFTALKKQVVDMKAMDTLKEEMTAVLHENYELKKKLNETLTKIDHVRRT